MKGKVSLCQDEMNFQGKNESTEGIDSSFSLPLQKSFLSLRERMEKSHSYLSDAKELFIPCHLLVSWMSSAITDFDAPSSLVWIRWWQSCFSNGLWTILIQAFFCISIVLFFIIKSRTVIVILEMIVCCSIRESIPCNLCIKWSNLDTGIVTTRRKNRRVSGSQSLVDMIIIRKVSSICYSMTGI